MGSLQDELKKLKLVLPEQVPTAPPSTELVMDEQRKLAGIVELPEPEKTK